VGYLARYGSRLKTETENGVFLQRYGKRFSLKNGKRYGFRLRCRVFLSPNRGNGRSRNGRVRYGTVRYGTVRVTNSDPLLYLSIFPGNKAFLKDSNNYKKFLCFTNFYVN
jgi:hypothetical protein